jgi:hypothetical protein
MKERAADGVLSKFKVSETAWNGAKKDPKQPHVAVLYGFLQEHHDLTDRAFGRHRTFLARR